QQVGADRVDRADRGQVDQHRAVALREALHLLDLADGLRVEGGGHHHRRRRSARGRARGVLAGRGDRVVPGRRGGLEAGAVVDREALEVLLAAHRLIQVEEHRPALLRVAGERVLLDRLPQDRRGGGRLAVRIQHGGLLERGRQRRAADLHRQAVGVRLAEDHRG
ncbi:MAG: hypothetical protein ACK559_29135, partial [bacterium]